MSDTTRSIQLSVAHSDYLLGARYLPPELREVVAAARLESPPTRLDVSNEVADRFQTVLTEQLAKVGFSEDYSLTHEGDILENLIDLFDGE
jgi:hypothetical protein